MYNNPYMNGYNPNLMQQSINDKIDNEIAKLQQMKNHNTNQPAINQTFQLAPNSNGIKFVNNIDDVQKEFKLLMDEQQEETRKIGKAQTYMNEYER